MRVFIKSISRVGEPVKTGVRAGPSTQRNSPDDDAAAANGARGKPTERGADLG
jgi:hypothetical protein